MKTRPASSIHAVARLLLALTLVGIWGVQPVWGQQTAPSSSQLDIAGPPGSEWFGDTVTALPNGNIVITDPYYDAGAVVDVGAAYLYDGGTGALISMMTGTTEYDQVGSHGVVVLANGNFVVRSAYWNDGPVAVAGAATWGSGTTGITGTVSAANSLVGSTAYDGVGEWVTALPNGHYVLNSHFWDDSAVGDAGAVTWGNGTTGTAGPVSAANSLVGSSAGDRVGGDEVTVLSNGNYVVRSPNWSNGPAPRVGAVTWANGTTGITGAVSSANSLVGSRADDRVGYGGVTPLSNGHYVVGSELWDNGAVVDAGAATWGNGTAGITGAVSAANSLVGSRANDKVGAGVTALSNGHFVVSSPQWNNGAVLGAGAATWGDGTTGITGTVSVANSLVGGSGGDGVGSHGVTALANGNYVVRSRWWRNGTLTNAGAATWGNGTTGITGTVSAANSLVGSSASDQVGFREVTVLSNGNYVVISDGWDNGAATNAGAATWGNGATGTAGVVSAANSVVGSSADDWVGSGGVTALANGNYVVGSPSWNNGAVVEVGAATWGNGATGITGTVSAANSLVGSTARDYLGLNLLGPQGVTALANGHYVVSTPWWTNGTVVYAGAATWGNGTTGITGTVSAANSLVGSILNDDVSSGGVTALTNGHYVVLSDVWDDGAAANVGAVTWGDGATGITGTITAANSLVGSTAEDQIGSGGVTALSNGTYVVKSLNWDNGTIGAAGAITWGSKWTGMAGPLTAQNSVLGVTGGAGPGGLTIWAYDAAHNQLVVGRRYDNIVTLFRPSGPAVPATPVFLPLLVRGGP